MKVSSLSKLPTPTACERTGRVALFPRHKDMPRDGSRGQGYSNISISQFRLLRCK